MTSSSRACRSSAKRPAAGQSRRAFSRAVSTSRSRRPRAGMGSPHCQASRSSHVTRAGISGTARARFAAGITPKAVSARPSVSSRPASPMRTRDRVSRAVSASTAVASGLSSAWMTRTVTGGQSGQMSLRSATAISPRQAVSSPASREVRSSSATDRGVGAPAATAWMASPASRQSRSASSATTGPKPRRGRDGCSRLGGKNRGSSGMVTSR